MEFERPVAFWLLLVLLPILFTMALAVRSFYKFSKISNAKEFLAYSRVPTWRRRIFACTLYLLAISSCIVAFAEPYVYYESKDKEYSNIRILFVVDVSRSMVFAEDVPPNRLEATKKQIKEFYNGLDGNYECSILPFAGDVNPYFCPFTTSRKSFLDMLEELDWRSVPTLGTDLTRSMEAIEEIYIKQDHIDKSGLNIVILLSDGGKEEAIATNRVKLMKATRNLAAKNFKVYTVGVGSDKPAPLVIRDTKGGFVRYVTDGKNQIATSQMDEEILQQIAENGNGKYYSLNSSTALAYDLEKVIKENRKLVSEKMKLEKLDLQHYLFSVTVILLMACLVLNKV
jgi:Ca-activated chloride channel family protein